MEIILLIVSDLNLRQLYHELLLSKNLEIVPSDKVEKALIILALDQIKAAIFYVDSDNYSELETFLNLRKRYKKLLKTKIILLTDEETSDFNLFGEDIILNPVKLTPLQIVDKIEDYLTAKPQFD